MYDFSFQSVLEQLVNCFPKASGGNNMNCPEKGSFYCKYILIGKEKAGWVV